MRKANIESVVSLIKQFPVHFNMVLFLPIQLRLPFESNHFYSNIFADSILCNLDLVIHHLAPFLSGNYKSISKIIVGIMRGVLRDPSRTLTDYDKNHFVQLSTKRNTCDYRISEFWTG